MLYNPIFTFILILVPFCRYANLDKLTNAISDTQAALKLQPDHPNAKLYLEKCLKKKRDLDQHRQSLLAGEYLMVKNRFLFDAILVSYLITLFSLLFLFFGMYVLMPIPMCIRREAHEQ